MVVGAHVAAGAKFLAAGSIMFALAGAAQGSAGGGGSAGGAGAAARHTAELEGDRGEALVIVEGGLLDMTDPRQAEAFARAMQDISGRRVVVRGRS